MSEYPSPRSAPARFRLPPERNSIVHKIDLAGLEGYIIVGLYDDGTPGEIDIRASRAGSTLGGILNAFSIAVSLGLQSGIPVQKFIDKYKHMRFEPMGYTENRKIGTASSIIDYVAQWLEHHFPQTVAMDLPVAPEATQSASPPATTKPPKRNGTSTTHSTSSADVQVVPMMAKSS